MYMNPFKNKIVNTDEVGTSYLPARFVSIKLNSDGSPTVRPLLQSLVFPMTVTLRPIRAN